MLAPQRLEVAQRRVVAHALHVRARQAEADLGVVGKRAVQDGLVGLHRGRRITHRQQRGGQAHLVLRRGCVLERGARLPHFAGRIQQAARGTHRAEGLALQARVGQVDRQEVDGAAQDREGKQDEKPIQLLARAHHVDGAEDGQDEIQPDGNRHGIPPSFWRGL
ncbi:hypothetical protein LZ009_23800 [Ramlibacter sp. XY19]|nr:hypothetical protein [Ramlibacter paludis]MCG2595810.1 hypothetical protein [Ramlibacter paludis]